MGWRSSLLGDKSHPHNGNHAGQLERLSPPVCLPPSDGLQLIAKVLEETPPTSRRHGETNGRPAACSCVRSKWSINPKVMDLMM